MVIADYFPSRYIFKPGADIVLTESASDIQPEQLWIYDGGFLVNVRSGLFLTIPVAGSDMGRLFLVLWKV